eukprot:7187255-Prymnesium_polylepis.1
MYRIFVVYSLDPPLREPDSHAGSVCSLSLLKAVLESFTQEKRCKGSVTVVLLALQCPKGSLIS